MTQKDQIAEMHSDVKAILAEKLPSIEMRLTAIETRGSVVRGVFSSVWGAVAGTFSAIITHLVTSGRPHS